MAKFEDLPGKLFDHVKSFVPGWVIFQDSEHYKAQLLVELARLEIECIQEDRIATTCERLRFGPLHQFPTNSDLAKSLLNEQGADKKGLRMCGREESRQQHCGR